MPPWHGSAIVIGSAVLPSLKVGPILSAQLYPSSAIFGKRVIRALITILVGALGPVFSALDILGQFVPFLMALAVVVSPFAGIMLVDYYLLRRHREQLEESAARGALPAHQEKLVAIVQHQDRVVFTETST